VICFLSYPLSKIVPGYGNPRKKMEIVPTRSLAKGDACNIYSLRLDNHSGTHVDCPAHFCKGGKRVADFPAQSWCFKSPQVIKVKLKPGELLTPRHLKLPIEHNADLLLFQSGWAKCRGRVRYSRQNPGVCASLAKYLRSRFPKVRAIGFDWISLSSFMHREKGWEAHRAFLGSKRPGRPILIIEDMDLRAATPKLKEVWVAPLRIRGMDSAPCTIFASH